IMWDNFKFNTYFPGREVPHRFSYKITGSTISFTLPSFPFLKVKDLNLCLVYKIPSMSPCGCRVLYVSDSLLRASDWIGPINQGATAFRKQTKIWYGYAIGIGDNQFCLKGVMKFKLRLI
ncbi:unnamed protein product, partial [Ilex paraguariensis]